MCIYKLEKTCNYYLNVFKFQLTPSFPSPPQGGHGDPNGGRGRGRLPRRPDGRAAGWGGGEAAAHAEPAAAGCAGQVKTSRKSVFFYFLIITYQGFQQVSKSSYFN